MKIVLLLGFADAIFRRERSDDRKCVCASQARENWAGAKDRGRRLTSTFLPQESHLKRLSTVLFSEVGGFFI